MPQRIPDIADQDRDFLRGELPALADELAESLLGDLVGDEEDEPPDEP